MRVAAIDLGTVSSRLLTAVVEDGLVVSSTKHTVITDLGQGVDATGRLNEAAIERVVEACAQFVREIADFGPDAICTTLTSAARDAENGAVLFARLEKLGLRPQVIPGEVEARLTFYGVAHDFPGQRIAVADSGGGSTEFVVGSYVPGQPLELGRLQSLDIGCRRITDRYLVGNPPTSEQINEGSAWALKLFESYWHEAGEHPDRLVAVGGTVTTLVAMANELAVYDSSFVHLHELTGADVAKCIGLMRVRTVDQIAELPGIQPQRAPVMLGGALIMAFSYGLVEYVCRTSFEDRSPTRLQIVAAFVGMAAVFLLSFLLKQTLFSLHAGLAAALILALFLIYKITDRMES